MARRRSDPLAQLGLMFSATPAPASAATGEPKPKPKPRKAPKAKAAPKPRKAPKAKAAPKPRKAPKAKKPRTYKSRARTTADSQIHVSEYDRRRGRLPRRHPAGEPRGRGGRWKPDSD